MFVLVDRDQLRELGERLAESFAEGRAEIIGAAVLLGGAAIVLLLYAIRGRGRARRAERRAERRRYRAVVSRAALTDVEQGVLDRALRAARGARIAPARLVTQAGAFDRVAEQLLAREKRDADRGGRRSTGPPLETTLSALRVKLRTHRPALGNVRSTTDLPSGAPALVRHAAGRLVGRLGEHRPRALSVQLRSGGSAAAELAERTPVELAVPLSSGLYRARTVVLRSDASSLLLAHRERLDRTQRRAWARGRSNLHAWLVLDAGEGAAHLVTVAEVGGGGATCVPAGDGAEPLLQVGDRCVVRILGQPLAVAATVLRISRRGTHIGFARLRDSERDRLLGLALAGQRESVMSSATASPRGSASESASTEPSSRDDNASMVARSIDFSPPTR